jgi:hypothetical protein
MIPYTAQMLRNKISSQTQKMNFNKIHKGKFLWL